MLLSPLSLRPAASTGPVQPSFLQVVPRLLRRALAGLIVAGLLLPQAALAVPDEVDHYTVDEYRYDRDGDTPMRVNDDPGNGGPVPTGAPLGSDLASMLVFVGGAWYARRRLQHNR